jgi:2-C-methyl-D-erythritol 4-phosphate cytidylyltransferase
MEQVLEQWNPEEVKNHPFCSAVIVAAGTSSRMDSRVNKVYLELLGKKAIIWTLEPFENSPFVDEIILVINQKDVDYCKTEVLGNYKFNKLTKITIGGNSRQKSVYNGLKEVSKNAELVLIHDGARCLVTKDIIQRSIEGADAYDAVTVGVPVIDTIKTIDNDGFAKRTLDKRVVRAIQTPQVFKKDIILRAHEKAKEELSNAPDDSVLVENIGQKVKIIEGSCENIKLTTLEDIALAEAILRERIGACE